MNIHCIGIAGSGMLPLAIYLQKHGHDVTGSDRFRDRNVRSDKFRLLEHNNITLYPQDGSGITESTEKVIYSVAVEDDNPDIAKARRLNIMAVPRPDALADIFNESHGIAVGGTSGKSTTAGMIGFILYEAGLSPCLINGASILNFRDDLDKGSFIIGDSDILCIEADESDGSITRYRPETGILLNISKDHKEVAELQKLFTTFATQSKNVIFNADCRNTAKTGIPKIPGAVSFSLSDKNADYFIHDIQDDLTSISFCINDCRFILNMPGTFNTVNAAAACIAAAGSGISLEQSSRILSAFQGMERRMNIIGRNNSITVIDDFAHNPEKIAVALQTAGKFGQRLVVMYQPHGFGPTYFIKDELIKTFSEILTNNDMLFITEIFYAGGTAQRNISSDQLVKAIAENGINAQCITREKAVTEVSSAVQPGDTVIVMGARDITLGHVSRDIFEIVEQKL